MVVLFAIAALPIALSLIWFEGLPKPRTGADETRCRKCGYILRGISEPRCPECGERI